MVCLEPGWSIVFVYDTRRHFLPRLDADVSFSLPARMYHGLINAMACKEILPVRHEILTYQQFQKRANNVNAKDTEAANMRGNFELPPGGKKCHRQGRQPPQTSGCYQ